MELLQGLGWGKAGPGRGEQGIEVGAEGGGHPG